MHDILSFTSYVSTKMEILSTNETFERL